MWTCRLTSCRRSTNDRRVYTHEIPVTGLMGRAVKLSFGPYEATSYNIGLDEITEWETLERRDRSKRHRPVDS